MLAKWLQKYPGWILFLLFSWTTFSAFLLPGLQVVLDFSNYLPAGSSDLAFYEAYRTKFGSKDDQLTIGLYRREGIFEPNFLAKVEALTDSCRSLPLVDRVSSLTALSIPRKTPFGILSSPLVPMDSPEAIRAARERVMDMPLIVGRYLSGEGTTTNVMLDLSPERELEETSRLVRRLDQILAAFDFEEFHIAGMPDMEVRYAWLSQRELKRFVVLSLLMIGLVLWVIYRSAAVIFLSLGVFLLSLINMGGFLVLAGWKLDIMATMIPSIILIVSISDSVHIFSRFTERENEEYKLLEGLHQVSVTNFFTSLTTALGFFTLLLSPMPMLYYFGLYVGIGVLLAYLISILFIPSIIFLFGLSLQAPRGWFSPARWKKTATGIFLWQLGRGRLIAGLCLLFLLIAAWGISRIDTNRSLASPMPKHHRVAESFRFFEREMAGARAFELAVIAEQDGGLGERSNLIMLEKLHAYLDALPELGGLVSPVSYYKYLNSFAHAGKVEHYALPATEDSLRWLERVAPASIKAPFRTVIDDSRTEGAFRGRMPDMGKNLAAALIQRIDAWIAENIDGGRLTFRHTGSAVILDLVNDVQIRAMGKGLILAIVVISLAMALLFRNGRLIWVTLIVNLIPLLIVMGLMGFLGIELRGGTSIVFTIAFVIVVDDTIHLCGNVFFRKSKGMGLRRAIEQALRSTGHPILITSLVIFLAFLLLITSGFGNVKNLGLLVSLAVVFALFGDLFLAPLLLIRLIGGGDRPAKGEPRRGLSGGKINGNE